MKIKKNHAIILFLLIIFLGFIYFNHKNFSKDRTIVRLKGVSVNEPIEDFSLASKSVFLWADPVLYITDREGNIVKKIQREDENIEAFFANNYAFLYEKDLGKVHMYSEMGELLSTTDVKGDIFNITYENANIIFHVVDEKNEILYLPVLIVKKREDNKNSFFKSNIKKIDLRNGNLLLYNPSTYCVSDLDDMISETYDYYLDKEYVNEVQINVANSISRIGTTIIE